MEHQLRFVQICVSPTEGGDGILYGLTAGGEIYIYSGKRHNIGETYQGRVVKDWFYSEPFWQPMSMSAEEPPLRAELVEARLGKTAQDLKDMK